MTAVERFDRWIRREFVDCNTELEEAYFSARSEVLLDRPNLDAIKQMILQDGADLIGRISEEGPLPADADDRYRLLGAVGFYLGACRRHEVDGSEGETGGSLAAAWSLANRLGSSLGVAPRFVFAHQSLYNLAVHGRYRTFTSLDDEQTFVDNNAMAVLAYQRAANALRRIPAIGVSNPMATYLFEDARAALDDVMRFNRALAQDLDVDRFFLNIRPYFKPHRVGNVEYRGVNAGDFAAVNEIDLLLGLCRADDPFYQEVLAEKYAYMPPEDQVLLRTAVTRRSLLDDFLHEAATGPVTPQLRRNAELFLGVCRSHGAAYAYHHHKLVKPFLEQPAKTAPENRLDDLTASGPPLDVVIDGLARLNDLRSARERPGVTTARPELDRLGKLLTPTSRADPRGAA